ncbi:DUF6675 family protein [Spirochaeta lutea]|nr:DUF6675 family protein [Spirochaeta lutea]
MIVFSKAIRPSLLFICLILWLLPSVVVSQESQGQPRPDFFLPLTRETAQVLLSGIPVTDSQIEEFMTTGMLIRLDSENAHPDLNPLPQATADIRQAWESNPGNITIQTLIAYPLPKRFATLTEEEIRLRLYNTFSRYSTMAGIEYWSESRQRMRTFYIDSYRINPDFPDRPLPDATYQQVPPKEYVTLRQRDASFGDNRYRLTINNYPEGIHARIENLTTMWYKILPIAEPQGVRMDLCLSIKDSYLLFFGSTRLQAPGIFGIRDRAEDSFFNRLIALYNWYTGLLTEN